MIIWCIRSQVRFILSICCDIIRYFRSRSMFFLLPSITRGAAGKTHLHSEKNENASMHINRNRITSPFYPYTNNISQYFLFERQTFSHKLIRRWALLGCISIGISHSISVSRALEIPNFPFKTGYQMLPQPNFICWRGYQKWILYNEKVGPSQMHRARRWRPGIRGSGLARIKCARLRGAGWPERHWPGNRWLERWLPERGACQRNTGRSGTGLGGAGFEGASKALARKALTFVQGTHGSIQRHVVRLPYLG